jgi:hypothetical protein
MKKSLVKHRELEPHHRYQLEIIFLFTVGLLLLLPYYLIMEEFRVNMLDWQWYFFWPWMSFFVLYSMYMRRKIRPEERIKPLKRPIVHWVLLGLVIVFYNLQPGSLEKLQSIDLMFIIFSIFLADSYWDFRNMVTRNQ